MPRITKKQRLLDYVASRRWTRIGEAEWNNLRLALPDISERMLRISGLASGLSIDEPWRGVIQDSLDHLERSLCEMGEVYQTRPDLAKVCRAVVIMAKDHARLASQNPRLNEEKRKLKAEMVEWRLVWLDDPAMFPVWAKLRRMNQPSVNNPASAKIKNCSDT